MHVHMLHHVLITKLTEGIAGSHYATREMLDYARRAVKRAHEKGYIILVGDHAKSVDMAVVVAVGRTAVRERQRVPGDVGA